MIDGAISLDGCSMFLNGCWHQLLPREAVPGDLVWHDYHPKDHDAVRAVYLNQLRHRDFEGVWVAAKGVWVEANTKPYENRIGVSLPPRYNFIGQPPEPLTTRTNAEKARDKL